jgi:microcystin degradation protein MlrC
VSGSANEEDITCPECKAHTFEDAGDAEKLVISAARALIHKNDDIITSIAKVATGFDFHVAVTMYTELLIDMCTIFEKEPDDILDKFQAVLNLPEGSPELAALREAAEWGDLDDE